MDVVASLAVDISIVNLVVNGRLVGSLSPSEIHLDVASPEAVRVLKNFVLMGLTTPAREKALPWICLRGTRTVIGAVFNSKVGAFSTKVFSNDLDPVVIFSVHEAPKEANFDVVLFMFARLKTGLELALQPFLVLPAQNPGPQPLVIDQIVGATVFIACHGPRVGL